MSLLLSIIISILIVYLIQKLLIKAATWKLTRSFALKVQVRSIGLFYLRDVQLTLPGQITVRVPIIRFGSSLFSSRYSAHAVIIAESPRFLFENEPCISTQLPRRHEPDPSTPTVEDVVRGWQQVLLGNIRNALRIPPLTWMIVMTDASLRNEFFELHSDSAKFEIVSDSLTITLNNSEIKSLVPLTVEEVNTSNASHPCLQVTEFQFIRNSSNNSQVYIFRNEIYIQWTPLLHVSIVSVYRDFKQLIATCKGSGRPQTPSNSPMHKASSRSIEIDLEGHIKLALLLSNEGQSMHLTSSHINFSMPAKNRAKLESKAISLYCDERHIAHINEIDVKYIPEQDAVYFFNREEFAGSKLFTMRRNHLLWIEVGDVELNFPYKYDFADTFNERFITATKWIRKYHGITSSPDSVSHDLMIRIGSICLQIEDDPFEVKLRNNYELLEDEYHEAIKRQQALDVTISNMRKENIILPDKTIQLMKEDLVKKKHTIYITRHKRLYESPEKKYTHIFTLNTKAIELKLAADKSLVDRKKLMRLIRQEIDPLSPLPEDMSFNTMWCRQVIGRIDGLSCKLRNFPQAMIEAATLSISGRLLGAEATASHRARRCLTVDFGPELDGVVIERTMPPLKLYHDICLNVHDGMKIAHGAAWEPVLAQLSLCFENIIKPSRDPSPGLPWWDKLRLLFHGRLVVVGESLSIRFHASLDPYNKTEFMEMVFIKSIIEWTTSKINIKGLIDMTIHTASKYDDRRIFHMPHLDACVYLNWDCLGNQYDHHSVMPCAPDKVPEYSSNQEHDSFRAFRSQNLNVKISIETRTEQKDLQVPTISVFSNSIRWLENQKQLFTGLTRLTRRGKLFNNTRARKPQFSRIFKKVQMSVCLHKLKSEYWSSFNRQYGIELSGENFTHSAEYVVTLQPISDDLELRRRARPLWNLAYMNCEVRNVEVILLKGREGSPEKDDPDRMFLLSITRVAYNRVPHRSMEMETDIKPTHQLVVHDLKGEWTIVNKEVVFALYDLYQRAQSLRRNLSTEALKGFKVEGSTLGRTNSSPFRISNLDSLTGSKTSLNKNYAATMLKKLIAESENNSDVVYSEDVESELIADEVKLRGVASCQEDDVLHKNWLIELINSQVMLRGCETSGYVIASAAKCQIWQRINKPVWKERTLLSKESWVGVVDCMQYYATVDERIDSNVVWLGVDSIQQNTSASNDLVASTHRVGGVVSSLVNPADITVDGTEIFSATGVPVQLQRIISRCACSFYYVFYTESIDLEKEKIPPIPDDDDLLEPWDKEVAVDSFALVHTELDVSTNSQQYAMIIDLVNNLLLYVEPHRKEASEKLQHMKFEFQLSSLEEQREPISSLQDALRKLMIELKQSERECHRLHKAVEDSNYTDQKSIREHGCELERMDRLKTEINDKSDDLAMRISCYKEAQILADKDRERQELNASGRLALVVKRIEVCFKQASWALTDSDGQLQLANISLNDFLYTKLAKNDDSVEHTLELGFIRVQNSIPNQAYLTVLEPTDLGNRIPFDRRRALRIFCRERSPVAGIPVKEHFEVNVIPVTIAVTKQFYRRMVKFFFPDPEDDERHETRKKRRKRGRKEDSIANETASVTSSQTNYSTSSSRQNDRLAIGTIFNIKNISVRDVEKMRKRAEKNQTFVHIKISEVPITVSYRGGKMVFENCNLVLPTIEYHNQTWTWLDVLMAIKGESHKRLIPQAVKQKFWPSRTDKPATKDENSDREDTEMRVRLLEGDFNSPVANAAAATATSGSRSNRLSSLFKTK